MTGSNTQTKSRTASDLTEVQDAMSRLHAGNLNYKNYKRRVFVTSEMRTEPLRVQTHSSQRRRAFTLNPGQGDNIVMLDSGEIALRIGDFGSQFRMVKLDTAIEEEFLQVQTVMRKWASMPIGTVKAPGAK